MTGESNLDRLLASMSPKLQEDPYVFLTNKEPTERELKEAVGIFREIEGITLIVKESLAKELGREYQSTFAMITLTVHSDLNAVGFTAAISTKLAEAGISCNVMAGYYHDHIFVQYEKREQAMEILQSFQK